jgi:hypothetical protein
MLSSSSISSKEKGTQVSAQIPCKRDCVWCSFAIPFVGWILYNVPFVKSLPTLDDSDIFIVFLLLSRETVDCSVLFRSDLYSVLGSCELLLWSTTLREETRSLCVVLVVSTREFNKSHVTSHLCRINGAPSCRQWPPGTYDVVVLILDLRDNNTRQKTAFTRH